jgi:hypothetical protein
MQTPDVEAKDRSSQRDDDYRIGDPDLWNVPVSFEEIGGTF